MTIEFRPGHAADADIFQLLCVEAASSSKPTYIGDIVYDPSTHFEQWIAEGDARMNVNTKTGKAHSNQKNIQKIPGVTFTVDQLGRICEGPVELLLGLDVAAVVENGTDDRPDKTFEGIRFDVKGATKREENSFAIPCWQALSGKYDALMLVQHLEVGRVRVWVCKCKPAEGWMKLAGSKVGKKPFYRIACPLS
jgi:hypothetical protein